MELSVAQLLLKPASAVSKNITHMADLGGAPLFLLFSKGRSSAVHSAPLISAVRMTELAPKLTPAVALLHREVPFSVQGVIHRTASRRERERKSPRPLSCVGLEIQCVRLAALPGVLQNRLAVARSIGKGEAERTAQQCG